jgi:hypothetical protein
VIARSAIHVFHSRVTGLGGRSPDGSERLAVAARCEPGERLVIAPDPDHPRRPGAIRVTRESGELLGHLPRHWLRRIAHRMASGWRYAAVVTESPPGRGRRRPRRLGVAVFAGRPGVTDEVWEAALESEVAPARLGWLWVALGLLLVLAAVWLAL